MTERLYLKDLKEYRYCHKGLRRFCVLHGVDWGTFLKEGISLEEVKKIDDEYVKKVIGERYEQK